MQIKEIKNKDNAISREKKVLVAMSGGVDSSVAAYLLAEEGYEIVGITMYFNEFAKAHLEDAARVCNQLGIKHICLDLTGQMKKKVIAPFVKEYFRGRTPNPCIECNRFIKFGLLFDYAAKEGYDYFATGHYAAIKKSGGVYGLYKAVDIKKDQSYFLYAIKKENLAKILFPLANLTKQEVKKIAAGQLLPVTLKKESQEICFIKDNDYKSFIAEHTGLLNYPVVPGNIKDTEGNIIGKHEGILGFTIGQRKGIKISAKNPLYVLEIDAESNSIVVGPRQHLSKNRLTADRLNFFVGSIPERTKAKIRYNSRETECSINIKKGKADVIFDVPRDAITPGQSVVFYSDDMVLGGGIIEDAFCE